MIGNSKLVVVEELLTVCVPMPSQKKTKPLNQKTQDHEGFDDSLEMLFSVMQIFFLQFHALCDIFIIMQLTSVSKSRN